MAFNISMLGSENRVQNGGGKSDARRKNIKLNINCILKLMSKVFITKQLPLSLQNNRKTQLTKKTFRQLSDNNIYTAV